MSITLEEKISVIAVLDLSFSFKQKDVTSPNKPEVYGTKIETSDRKSSSCRAILFAYVMESNLLGDLFDIWTETLLLQQVDAINNVASVIYNVATICFLSGENVISTENYESEVEKSFLSDKNIDKHKNLYSSISTTDEGDNKKIDDDNCDYINHDLMYWWPTSFTSFMDLFLDTSTKLWFKSERKNSGNLLFKDIGVCFTALIAIVKIHDSRKASLNASSNIDVSNDICTCDQ
jgi:hypothetical protein